MKRTTGTVVRKRFGQHFLASSWAAKVAGAIGAQASDVVLEIGPGRGALTHLLSAVAAHVLAFEIDRDLVPLLRQGAPPNLSVVQGDFLGVNAGTIREALKGAGVSPDTSLRVTGNLPYNVASPILFKLTELYASGLPIVDASVMIQRPSAPPSAVGYS